MTKPTGRPPGRPTAFREEMINQARKLTHMGATDRDLADFFEVTEQTIHNWKLAHPDFAEALVLGKDAADKRVEQSLYRRALGYSFDSEKIFQFNGQPVRVPYVEHVPPSDAACIFWLKNRKPDEWRQVVDHNHQGQIVMAITPDDEQL